MCIFKYEIQLNSDSVFEHWLKFSTGLVQRPSALPMTGFVPKHKSGSGGEWSTSGKRHCPMWNLCTIFSCTALANPAMSQSSV